MSEPQPQRRPRRVFISRQVDASVGENQRAHHPGGGEGDGKIFNPLMSTDIKFLQIKVYLLVLLQEREAEFEESFGKEDAPVVSIQFCSSCNTSFSFL